MLQEIKKEPSETKFGRLFISMHSGRLVFFVALELLNVNSVFHSETLEN